MGLGAQEEITLAKAREERDKWSAILLVGNDPIDVRNAQREAKRAERDKTDPTFAEMAQTVFEARKANLRGEGTRGRWFSPIELHMIPAIGKKRMSEIHQTDIRDALKPIWRVKAPTAEKAFNRTRIIFKSARLSPEEVLELARASGVTERVNQQGQRLSIDDKSDEEIELDDEQLRTRAALLQSASSKLTKSFKDWWKQGDYRFRLQADGHYFRIWVSDGRRTEEIELENRSTGLQWFLSFFLVFTYESEDTHDNAIVLLDEPGHSLHPLAQRDLSTFFDSLARTNQIVFTTHSPFMIDADRLDRVRKVYVDDVGGTVASSNLGVMRGKGGIKDAGATYAVHSALNLTVAESLLIGCTPVIVEGPSDQHYLSAIKTILIRQGKIKPSAELVFPPSGGAKTAKIIASILMGRDDTLPFVLLDGDSAGLQAAQSLKSTLYSECEDRVLNIDAFTGGAKNSEIEDLLPAALLVQVLDRMERRAEQDFEDCYQEGMPIVPQIKAWAKAEGFELEPSWKAKLSLGVKAKLLSDPGKHVDDQLTELWAKMFKVFG